MIDYQEEKNSQKLIRLREVMKKLGLKSDLALANALGISNGYMSEMMSGKKKLSKNLGQKLEDNLGVRRRWYETGEGEVFLKSENSTDTSNEGPKQYLSAHEQLDYLKKLIESQQAVIDMLQAENRRLNALLSNGKDPDKSATG